MSSSSSSQLQFRSISIFTVAVIVIFLMFVVPATSLRAISTINTMFSRGSGRFRYRPRSEKTGIGLLRMCSSSSGGGRASAAVEQSKGGRKDQGGKLDLTPPKGTRDFYPDDKRLSNWLFGKPLSCIYEY